MKRIGILILTFVIAAVILCTAFSIGALEQPAYPQITAFKNIANGTVITWSAYPNAASYRVFLKSGENWKWLGDSSECAFTHTKLKNNTTCTYTVRALDAAGKYCSAYAAEGSTNTFFAAPKLASLTPVDGGMLLRWNSVPGVQEYMVYVKTESGWNKCGVSTGTYYIDKDVLSSKRYTYTVKCTKNGGKTGISWHDSKGISATYVAAPEVTGFENLANSLKITAKKSAGAYRYRFFVKTASGWKSFATQKEITATYKNVKNNTAYTFTVRAIGKNGKFVSGYRRSGFSTRFFAPPAITAVTPSESGNVLKWNANPYIAFYRLFKKTYGGKWALLTDTADTTWTDEAVEKNVLVSYTLRYMDEANHPLSAYLTSTRYYYNGAPANGKIKVNGKTLCFKDGLILQGLVKLDGKYYFYNASGILQKNGIVGSKKAGFFYADKAGVIDMTKRDGVKYNKALWLVLNGKAKRVKTQSDLTLYRAFMLLRECTNQSMTKEEKLYASFRYIQKITTEMNPRIPHYTGKNWHLLYANDVLRDRVGNCMSYGAAFAFLAKAIGYTQTYCCNSGGHGWAEVNHLVYDPEWDIHHKGSFYAVSYDANCGVDYKGAIAAGYSWMRVKI